MLVCISVILFLCVFLFLVYIVCSLSVSLPDLANKDVQRKMFMMHLGAQGVYAIMVQSTPQ